MVSDDQAAASRADLRLTLERQALSLEERRDIADAVRTSDDELIDRIAALGFCGESAICFDLLPLLHVAWADGKVQRKERMRILDVLSVRGCAPGSAGYELMASLLEEKPGEAYMRESMKVLRSVLKERQAAGATIVSMCLEVARSAGGLLGMTSAVSEAERAVIDEIARALGERARTELRRQLG